MSHSLRLIFGLVPFPVDGGIDTRGKRRGEVRRVRLSGAGLISTAAQVQGSRTLEGRSGKISVAIFIIATIYSPIITLHNRFLLNMTQ